MSVTAVEINDVAKGCLPKFDDEPQLKDAMRLSELITKVQEILAQEGEECVKRRLQQILTLYRGRNDLAIREIGKRRMYWRKINNDRNAGELSNMEGC